MFPDTFVYPSGREAKTIELVGYYVDFCLSKRNVLFITFENADQPRRPRLDPSREPWGLAAIAEMDCCILGVKPKQVDWYRGRDLHEFFKSRDFAVFTSTFSKVIWYGSSMGGYAALAFCQVVPGSDVIALNPQTTLDQKLVPWDTRFPEGSSQDWSGAFADAAQAAMTARRVYVAYDPLFAPDAMHVQRLDPKNVTYLKLPLLQHSTPTWMVQMGILKPLLREIADSDVESWHFAKSARKRKNLARYYATMGMLTHRRDVATECLQRCIELANSDANTKRDMLKVAIRHQLWEFAEQVYNNQPKDMMQESTYYVLRSLVDANEIRRAYNLLCNVQSTLKLDQRSTILASEVMMHMEKLEDAEALIYRVLVTDPNSGHALRVLARIKARASRWDLASDIALKAVTHDPTSFLGWYELSKYQEKLGQYDYAINSMLEAIAINPGDSSAKSTLTRLKSHRSS